MTAKEYSNKELKLTAALYASIPWVMEHVREHGTLPEYIGAGGMHIGMRLLIEKRGTDLTLSGREQMMYDAILKCRRLPGGKVLLIEEEEKRRAAKAKKAKKV